MIFILYYCWYYGNNKRYKNKKNAILCRYCQNDFSMINIHSQYIHCLYIFLKNYSLLYSKCLLIPISFCKFLSTSLNIWLVLYSNSSIVIRRQAAQIWRRKNKTRDKDWTNIMRMFLTWQLPYRLGLKNCAFRQRFMNKKFCQLMCYRGLLFFH